MKSGQVCPPKKLEPVKILFICSSLEPGKDGVGDYTRKLAAALIKKGCTTGIVAINDRRLESGNWQGLQQDNCTDVPVLRLSALNPWAARIAAAKKFADTLEVSWLSLQYVPFGFNIKGLPFKLGEKLLPIGKQRNWHIMFHELSVNRDESLKFRAWSYLQVSIIKSLIRRLCPAVLHTNTALYRFRLKEMRFDATVLPLFSNISQAASPAMQLYSKIIPAYIREHREDYMIGALFGSFDFKRWDMHSLLDKFSYGYSEKRVVIVAVGRMSSGHEYWETLKFDYPRVLFLDFGVQDAVFISFWLSAYTDFGILTTLPELAGKSGSFMAFREHGIPVVCKEKTLALQQYEIPLAQGLTEVSEAKALQMPLTYTPVSQLDKVAEQFINELAAAVKGQRSTDNSQ